jgi:orotate phosphoribosyltransferase
MTSDSSSPRTSTPSKKKIAGYLLDIGAVKLSVNQPFTWASGIKAPIYCDNRVIAAHVDIRNAILREYTESIYNHHYLADLNIIAGVATGGMTFGALIADRLSLPFIYVRPERKEHGLRKQVEGLYKAGDKVILIEDHISTGGSSWKAIEGLKNENLELICLYSIMTYGFKIADDLFKSKGVVHESLCDLDAVIEVAKERKDITPAQADSILRFRETVDRSHSLNGK